MTLHRTRLAVLIVSYGNPEDIDRCLRSLALSDFGDFEVLICENGGPEAFGHLASVINDQAAPLEQLNDCSDPLDEPGGRLADVIKCRFRNRANIVRLALATDNLGYGGGVNAWLERMLGRPDWDAVLVLNPDTQVGESCLSELMAKAAEGFGMVGATLV